jgi:hypothetical protein
MVNGKKKVKKQVLDNGICLLLAAFGWKESITARCARDAEDAKGVGLISEREIKRSA